MVIFKLKASLVAIGYSQKYDANCTEHVLRTALYENIRISSQFKSNGFVNLFK